jgi:hypothetical protein
LPFAFIGASASPAAAASSPKPITIAYVTDLTGERRGWCARAQDCRNRHR